MSGGRFKLPVGTVQLRIDQHEAWTITPQETPVSLAPAVAAIGVTVTSEQAEIVRNAQEQAMKAASQMMSPYTVATGDKARQIIRRQKLRYRIEGINQAASTTGEAVINASLSQSLRTIGIDPGTL